jgi:hypothetical protein
MTPPGPLSLTLSCLLPPSKGVAVGLSNGYGDGASVFEFKPVRVGVTGNQPRSAGNPTNGKYGG